MTTLSTVGYSGVLPIEVDAVAAVFAVGKYSINAYDGKMSQVGIGELDSG